MVATDSRTHAALDAATRRLGAAVATVATQVATALGGLATTSLRVAERDLLNLVQFELRRHAGLFQDRFLEALRDKVRSELAPRDDGARRSTGGDWQTLSLVDAAEMEERLHADRLGQAIAHACDAELRELAGYMGSLWPAGRNDLERHPLRAESLGTLVYRAIEVVSQEAGPRKILAREFGLALGKTMPACYAAIVEEWHALGVRPVALVARSADAPGGGGSGPATLTGVPSQRTDFEASAPGSARGDVSTTGPGGRSTRSGPVSSARAAMPAGAGLGRAAPAGAPGAHADAALMSLLRRLTAVPSGSGELGRRTHFDDVPGAASTWPNPTRPGDPGDGAGDGATASRARLASAGDNGPVTGLMAVNLIRAYREELVQASSGQLDHRVIDVVGGLFDQILSDPRVPPHMARQIARLQLPVLRVALADASFFSSRRHPVRRFVNRMASLACAFDDFESGPGLQFITRVRELVEEIVDGDFDEIELYAAKLGDLERFIGEQTGEQAVRSGAAVALEKKETELRLQQRCRQHLQMALAPVPMPAWLRDFVQQVWSQALVVAAAPGSADTGRLQRYRRAGRDLVLSVQPKGSPAMRKKFLMQLPPLMKDLGEGMALVGWPQTAQQTFMELLLPAHAESMRLAPLSELDHNLMAKQLEAIFAPAPAAATSTSTGDALDEVESAAAEQRFSAEEAKAVGLIAESAVDWSGPVDIDIDLGAEPAADARGPASTGSPAIDIALDLDPAGRTPEAAEPSAGPGLIDHIKLGFAYQMHLQSEWQKVRLTHVSAGRGFFVFSRGKNHQETISMTARMLARMCETGRLRAFESAYLIERATQRARKQLAAMRPAAAARIANG